MAVHVFELFHGIALTKLVRNERPTTLRLIETNQDEAWAVYTINDAVDLLIKYVTTSQVLKRHGGRTWQFLFSASEIARMRALNGEKGLCAALVCGGKTLRVEEMAVCLLETVDLEALLDLSLDSSQSIRVKMLPGKSLRAQNTRGVERVIPRSALETWAIPGS